MKPEGRFALLTNGSDFSQRVVETLVSSQCLPSLIALPEYPPAHTQSNHSFNIQSLPAQPVIVSLLPGIPVVYAPKSNSRALIASLGQFSIDFILVACWPYLIDSSIYLRARKASLNLHPSMLPGYRGADPLTRQLADQAPNFGVTLHLLNDRFDRGEIVAQASIEVDESELGLAYLQQQCALVGVGLFIDALDKFTERDKS